jgi:TetR/AcrR family transcriptional regulator, transcriptional repressor for nem operon
MTRTKAFDREVVLDQAIDVFWERGYQATSLEDLLAHMQINRQSLYDTFGNKHALFLAALDRYEARNEAMFVALIDTDSVKDTIRHILLGLVEEAITDPRRRGCLMVNTVVELAPHDPIVAIQAANALQRITIAFEEALRRGQQRGEIGRQYDPVALALFVVNAIHGIRVLAKVMPDRAALRHVVDLTLAIFD